MTHLNGSKFRGTENGERKDWISTGDVFGRLLVLRGMTLTD